MRIRLIGLLVLSAAATSLSACGDDAGGDVAGFKTGFEARNGSTWTSLAEEQTYLRALDAASSHVAVSEIGRSVQDRPIRLVTVGAPRTKAEIASGSSVLFMCTQHGTEPAGREACLAAARDYVDSTESSTVLIIPTVNPDGFAIQDRHNADGYDINRDHSTLSTPEARAVASVTREYKPDAIVDMHEYKSPGEYQVKYGDPREWHPNVDAQINEATTTLTNSYLVPAIRAAGFSTTTYQDEDTYVTHNNMRQQTKFRHAASVLVETPRRGTLSKLQRVKVHRTATGAMVKAMSEEGTELSAITAGSAQRAIAEGAAGNQRYFYAPPSVYSDTPPCAYELTDAQYQSTKRTLGLHGITATSANGSWIVRAAQEAQPVIGLLLDSRTRSDEEITAGQPLPC